MKCLTTYFYTDIDVKLYSKKKSIIEGQGRKQQKENMFYF